MPDHFGDDTITTLGEELLNEKIKSAYLAAALIRLSRATNNLQSLARRLEGSESLESLARITRDIQTIHRDMSDQELLEYREDVNSHAFMADFFKEHHEREDVFEMPDLSQISDKNLSRILHETLMSPTPRQWSRNIMVDRLSAFLEGGDPHMRARFFESYRRAQQSQAPVREHPFVTDADEYVPHLTQHRIYQGRWRDTSPPMTTVAGGINFSRANDLPNDEF
jgi:hypothetical protein